MSAEHTLGEHSKELIVRGTRFTSLTLASFPMVCGVPPTQVDRRSRADHSHGAALESPTYFAPPSKVSTLIFQVPATPYLTSRTPHRGTAGETSLILHHDRKVIDLHFHV